MRHYADDAPLSSGQQQSEQQDNVDCRSGTAVAAIVACGLTAPK